MPTIGVPARDFRRLHKQRPTAVIPANSGEQADSSAAPEVTTMRATLTSNPAGRTLTTAGRRLSAPVGAITPRTGIRTAESC